MSKRALIIVSIATTSLLDWYGWEDSNLQNHGPKPCAYANSATPACIKTLSFFDGFEPSKILLQKKFIFPKNYIAVYQRLNA